MAFYGHGLWKGGNRIHGKERPNDLEEKQGPAANDASSRIFGHILLYRDARMKWKNLAVDVLQSWFYVIH